MEVQPYLTFNGRCEEAIEFYRQALGAEVQMLARFKDMPDAPPGMVTPATENKVMHASLKIGDSIILASDGRCQGSAMFEGFSLAMHVANEAEAKSRFGALSEGGQVEMPLAKTFFSSSFGMLKDRFGLRWMVLVRS